MSATHLYGQPATRAGLRRVTGAVEAIAGTELLVRADGPARGSRLVRLRTGEIEVEVLVDRALDLGQASVRGVPLAWASPAPLAGPWLGDPHGYGPLRTFSGGLLTTCGLEHVGEPAQVDISAFGYPGHAQEPRPLHGRLTFVPARLEGHGVDWRADEPTVVVSGTMTQARLLGEALTLERRISARVGEGEVVVSDVVRNDGDVPTPYDVLYHVNAGWPLVRAGAAVVGTVGTPEAAVAEADPADWRSVPSPDPSRGPRLWAHRADAGADGLARAAILCDDVGEGLAVGLEVAYDPGSLPFLHEWQLLRGAGHDVVALEPNTSGLPGTVLARAPGATVLEPGDERRHEVRIRLLHGREDVGAARRRCSSGAAPDGLPIPMSSPSTTAQEPTR